MDSKFRTSFIPKQEVVLSGRGDSSSRFSIFSIISVVIFTLSVILAIGVFIYQKTLVKSINSMNAELVSARASFEPSFVKELVMLDRKIESAKILINKHNVTTPIFNILESETMQGVRFTSFNYSLDSKGQPVIELKGEANNFYSVALQSDVFNSDSKIKAPVFSGLNVDDKGGAKFNIKGGLDSPVFLYKNTVNQSNEESSEPGSTDDSNGSGVDITPVP